MPAILPAVTRVLILGNVLDENVRMGKRITEARERKGWSKADLARRAGVAPSYVTRIEQGAFGRPSIDQVQALATALGVSVADLTGRLEDPAAAELRAALMAKGFRPDEAHIVDQILADLAGRPDRSRQQVLNAVATLLALRDEHDAAG